MPTRGPWASSRMRNGQEGVKIHRMRKKKTRENSTKTVTTKYGRQLAFHQGINEGK